MRCGMRYTKKSITRLLKKHLCGYAKIFALLPAAYRIRLRPASRYFQSLPGYSPLSFMD